MSDKTREQARPLSTRVSETFLANLAEWMLAMEAKSKLDGDPVSIEGLTDESGAPLGGVFLVKTPEAFETMRAAAEAAGLLTPGKGIVDGTVTEVRP